MVTTNLQQYKADSHQKAMEVMTQFTSQDSLKTE